MRREIPETGCPTKSVTAMWRSSLIFYTDLIMQTQKIRNLRINEAQESVLVEMIQYFNDCGWINEESSSDYDTLAETICDPGFWEYE